MLSLQYFDAQAVRSVGYADLIGSLREAHARLPAMADDMFMLEQRAIGEQPNGLLCRVAWDKGQHIGIKLATVFPGNADPSSTLPTTQALFVLFDGKTGSPVALIDGKSLTNLKTATDSALGASYLARADSDVLLMVGAGSVAPELISAHLSARPSISRVLIWNRTESKAIVLKERLSINPAFENVDIRIISDLEQGVRHADIVSCATAASKPILHGEWLREGTHVDLVGAYLPSMRESDDVAIKRSSIFVDSRRTTINDVGDIKTPIDSGLITEADIRADLYDLSSGRHQGRTDPSEITLFKNGGGGHLDLMTAQAVVAKFQGESPKAR